MNQLEMGRDKFRSAKILSKSSEDELKLVNDGLNVGGEGLAERCDELKMDIGELKRSLSRVGELVPIYDPLAVSLIRASDDDSSSTGDVCILCTDDAILEEDTAVNICVISASVIYR